LGEGKRKGEGGARSKTLPHLVEAPEGEKRTATQIVIHDPYLDRGK
jgi:hypothetical protein